jgi:hypothetical protein
MFLYLWIVFGLLAIHESIILSQHKINYQPHGFAPANFTRMGRRILTI